MKNGAGLLIVAAIAAGALLLLRRSRPLGSIPPEVQELGEVQRIKKMSTSAMERYFQGWKSIINGIADRAYRANLLGAFTDIKADFRRGNTQQALEAFRLLKLMVEAARIQIEDENAPVF